jgi:hypothetical protein
MSIALLEEMTGEIDISSVCPVKLAEWEETDAFGPFYPVAPVLLSETKEPYRTWEYRVCGLLG